MNILLSESQIDGKWAYPILKKIIHSKCNVLIIPFGFEGNQLNDWESLYSETRGSEYREHIDCFRRYGIQNNQITWLHYFKDSYETMIQKIEQSNLIFFTGGQPNLMMKRLKEKRLKKVLKNYQGMIMGYSAGAMIQLNTYHMEKENEIRYYSGLSYFSDFDIEVHYEKKDRHQERVIQKVMKRNKKPIYGIGNQGGLLIQNQQIECFGDVTIIEGKD